MTKALGAEHVSLWPSRASEERGAWWGSLQHQAGESGAVEVDFEGRKRK